jgi:4-oxalocrotonate tautomerase
MRLPKAAYDSRTNSKPDWKNMPLINVKTVEGVLTPEQKQDIIRKLTDAMVSIEGEGVRSVTWVVIEEVKSGSWGIAGNPVTTADAKALASSNPKGSV